ncbi:glycosyltransferase 87 family protein [Nocardia miyunensis]|uniref:glycosyltransferase 87 family protein n=1 Tax=Nocardia miyunensis TaxID=282684 RepID=UPI0008313788|nr:glycosyltransferase 87 family protein [Nocardia miyunensis]
MSLPTIEKPTIPSAARSKPPRRAIPISVCWAVAVVGVIAGGYYLDLVLREPRSMLHLTDLGVYQIAGHRVSQGISLYDTPLLGHTRGVMEFVYTPFAALLFVPLAGLAGVVRSWVAGLGNAAMVVVSAWAALSILGYRRDLRMAALGVPIAGLAMWCEPIRQTTAFGQVNILLLMLVLVDAALPDSARCKGVLTGVAAGIKLTPLFFVLYLLVTGRYRAAGMSVGGFAATVLVGALVMPRDSMTFWSGAFADPARVGVPQNNSNESLRGLLARTVGVAGIHQVLWLVAAAAIAVICLALARRLSRAGDELAAVALCGLTMTTVSPYSWVHHWVFLAPALIVLADLAIRRPGVVTAPIAVATAVIASGGVLPLLDVRASSVFDYHQHSTLYHNAYIWLTLALFAGAAGYLGSGDRMSREVVSADTL